MVRRVWKIMSKSSLLLSALPSLLSIVAVAIVDVDSSSCDDDACKKVTLLVRLTPFVFSCLFLRFNLPYPRLLVDSRK